MLLRCTTCLFSRPVSDMVNFKNDENVVQLFCGRFCVKSYKLRLTDEMDQGNPQWICQTSIFHIFLLDLQVKIRDVIKDI